MVTCETHVCQMQMQLVAKNSILLLSKSLDTMVSCIIPLYEEVGCLYYSPAVRGFVLPDAESRDAVPHFGRPGGVLPRLIDE